MSNVVFINDCAADGCKKKNLGNGKQLCKEHKEMYEKGIPFKGFYGKTVLKKEFRNKQKKYHENKNIKNENVKNQLKQGKECN